MHPLTRRTFLTNSATAGLIGGVARVAAKGPGGRTGTTDVQFAVTSAVTDRERCLLPRDVATTLGVGDGQQIRLRYDGAPAVFTVVVHDANVGGISSGGRDRLGATKDRFRAEIDTQVVHPTMSREMAAEQGEFVERHLPGSSNVVAIAPHGGSIEYGTDLQATRLATQLGATAWYAAGWWPGGGAYRRWHVTSTALEPWSFPSLDAIQHVGFDTAVSFHGWSEPHLAVGGAAPLELRAELRDEIETAVDGAFDVTLAADPTRDGTDAANVVNWLTASGTDGVQLEQPLLARREYRNTIADSAGTVLARYVA